MPRIQRLGLSAHQLHRYCAPSAIWQLTSKQKTKLRSLAIKLEVAVPQLADEARALADLGCRANFEAVVWPSEAVKAAPALDSNPARAFVLAVVAEAANAPLQAGA